MKVFAVFLFPLRKVVILLTSVMLWPESSFCTSSSAMSLKSGERMPTFFLFRLLWADAFGAMFQKFVIFKAFSDCLWFAASISQLPDCSFFH